MSIMAIKLILAFIISLAVTIAAGAALVPILRKIKAGQAIREDGPVWHNKKQGTPTMGGIMFIAGIAASSLIVGAGEIRKGGVSHIYILAFALLFAIIGFIDDYQKLRNKRNLGLKVVPKFALQILAAAAFLLVMRLAGILGESLYIPFLNVTARIPKPLYYAFSMFVVVGTVNSVNITDGVDGLATGVSIPVALCYAALAALWGNAALGIFSAALAGGLVAFLFFNFHPAKVFMGDTGALFLGGAICASAFALDMPLILVPLGIVYFIETLSDIIQIAYFKLTHGKRIFKMAPLHHHFEMSGWSEYKLFAVFTAVSAVFACIAYFGVRVRY